MQPTRQQSAPTMRRQRAVNLFFCDRLSSAAAGAKMQAEEGDNATEKPMWAETGGLDFDGRDKWEAWNRHKGLSAEEAKLAFCTAYARAMGREAENFRKY